MIIDKRTHVEIVRHDPELTGTFEPVFHLEHQDLEGLSNLSTYKLDLHMRVMKNPGKVYLELSCAGEYRVNKPLTCLETGDLYHCVLMAANEMNHFISQKELMPGHHMAPPLRQEMEPFLNEILKNRPGLVSG